MRREFPVVGGPPMNARSIVGGMLGATLFAACGSGADGTPLPAATERPEDIARLESVSTGPTRSRPLRADGHLPGVIPFRSGPQQAATAQCANPRLSYFGGPLIQSPKIVAVFWSSSVNSTLQSNIGQFYADVTKSSYWSWLQEYDSVGLASGTEQAILPGTLGGAFAISPQKCNPGGNGCRVTDADIQSELARQIGLGVLPAPTFDCTGNTDTLYMVSFAANVSLSGPTGVGNSCVSGGFCGYHNTGTYGASSTPLVYAALMDVFTGPCNNGCGGSLAGLDNATTLASHELVEMITDPDIGLDTQSVYASPAGWGDNNNMCGEIADICGDGTAGDTISVSGRSWVVQQLWSNALGRCTSTGSAKTVCSGTNVTNCRKCSCGDNGGACSGSKSVCETSTTNVLFGACEQCTATSATCTGAAACQQSSTASQDDVCPCTPQTSCPAGDDCGSVSNGCGGTIVCGTCTLPQSCGGGAPSNPNKCGCTPAAACLASQTCGSAPDGCGGTISCGVCGANQTCRSNQCVDNPVDAGMGDAAATTDAGVGSGSRDSGAAADGGSHDAAVAADTGSTGSGADSGAASGSADSGSLDDGSTGEDASAAMGGDADPSLAGTNPGSRGGCSCRTADGRDGGASPVPPAFAAAALLVGARVRRRRGLRAGPRLDA